MEPRLLRLLSSVIEEHYLTAEPVGSHALVERRKLGVSPATIRNWFAELESLGWIAQPHTSGGRVPTESGYRAYVDSMVRARPVSRKEHERLLEATKLSGEDAHRLKAVARILSEATGLAAIVGSQRADTFYTGLSRLFAQPEFQDWRRVVHLSGILDHLDDALQSLRSRNIRVPTILIGRDCPFGPACGAIVAVADDGLFGILGPMRLPYGRALSLVTEAVTLLSQHAKSKRINPK